MGPKSGDRVIPPQKLALQIGSSIFWKHPYHWRKKPSPSSNCFFGTHLVVHLSAQVAIPNFIGWSWIPSPRREIYTHPPNATVARNSQPYYIRDFLKKRGGVLKLPPLDSHEVNSKNRWEMMEISCPVCLFKKTIVFRAQNCGNSAFLWPFSLKARAYVPWNLQVSGDFGSSFGGPPSKLVWHRVAQRYVVQNPHRIHTFPPLLKQNSTETKLVVWVGGLELVVFREKGQTSKKNNNTPPPNIFGKSVSEKKDKELHFHLYKWVVLGDDYTRNSDTLYEHDINNINMI